MKFGPAALDLLKNVGSRGGPDKRLGGFVVQGNVVLDRFGQLPDATKDAPPKAVDRQIPKESFYHVEPGGAGRSEVKMKPWVALLPGFDLLMLVGGIVVTDEVNRPPAGGFFANQVQETDPFLMAVLVHAGSNDVAVSRVHSREQRGGAVSFVIMGQGLATPFLKRQSRLRAVQGLNLTLLVA